MKATTAWHEVELLTENPRQLSRARGRHEVSRIRPGYYVEGATWCRVPPWVRMGVIIAARAKAFPDTVFAGEAALFIHAMPLLDLPERIAIQSRPDAYPRVYPPLTDRLEGAVGRQRWGFDSRPGSVVPVEVNGLRVTPLDVAVGQYLLTADLRSGVVVLDAYRHRLREQGADLDAPPQAWLDTGIAEERARVLQAWEYSDPLAESPAETLTRTNAMLLGFERPRAQMWVQAADGKWYRLDLAWPGCRRVVEVDGKGKLGETDEERAAALEDERTRQEALQQMGFHVVRVTAEQARDMPRLREILAGNGIPWAHRG